MLARTLFVALVASSILATVANAGSIQIQTDKGIISGFSSGGVDHWRGIPFAAAPVGDLRLANPQPHAPWSGVLQTTNFGNMCPQLKGVLGVWLGQEDCLYLNVYAPSNRTADEKLPVLFWIYGGGWDLGDGFEFGLYDGTNLANKHNIIVVTPNYRLGPLGFMALQALANQNGQVGSYGIYDQLAALQWVQKNIAAFGGDPTQVTLAGESAGAFSICIHLTSKLSRGLFQSAILESGTCSSEIFFVNQKDSVAWGNTFAKIIGCDPTTLSDTQVLKCIRGLDLDSIMGPKLNYSYTGYYPLMFPAMPWSATIDGSLLTDLPINLIKSGAFNPVKTVVMGTNHDEGTIFVARMSTVIPTLHTPLIWSDTDALMDHFFNNNATVRNLVNQYYPQSAFPNATQLIETVLRDFFFLCPSSRAMLALDAYGVKTFLYQFVYPDVFMPTLGVYHSSEIEFVFGTAWPPLIHTFTPKDQVMADTFGYYWTNVVKYGDPNGINPSPQQVKWPRYEASTLQNMVLDVPASINRGLLESKCEMWDSISAYSPPSMKQRLRDAKEAVHIATE